MKKFERPAEEIGAVEILDGVEDAIVAHDLGEEWKQQVCLVAQIAAQRPAGAALVLLERRARPLGVLAAHDAVFGTKPSRQYCSTCCSVRALSFIYRQV